MKPQMPRFAFAPPVTGITMRAGLILLNAAEAGLVFDEGRLPVEP